VAEPDDDVWLTLATALTAEGFEVGRTGTYKETLAAIEGDADPDVILLEPRMGEGDETASLERVAALSVERGIRLVLTSNWLHAPAVARKYGLELLPMPFRLEEFEEAVQRATERCLWQPGRTAPSV
jgi:DNA-binding NtrC family response regulator